MASPDVLAPSAGPAAFVATDEELEAMLGRPSRRVPPPRPLHRNSTLEDLQSSAFGRLLTAQAIRYGIKRASVEFPDPDEATVAMVRTSILEGPLRGAVQMTEGAVSFAVLDRVLAAANGDWRGALRLPPGRPGRRRHAPDLGRLGRRPRSVHRIRVRRRCHAGPMCFSAEASFAGAAVVTAAGVGALALVKEKREVPFAALPLLFGIHQLLEGLTWLELDGQPERRLSGFGVHAWVMFAWALLPIYVPWAVWLIEDDPRRKRWMSVADGGRRRAGGLHGRAGRPTRDRA